MADGWEVVDWWEWSALQNKWIAVGEQAEVERTSRARNAARYKDNRAARGLTRKSPANHRRNRLPKARRAAVYHRDNYTCCDCQKDLKHLPDEWSIDHIVPVSRGGTNVISNLRMTCKGCNEKKGDWAHDVAGGQGGAAAGEREVVPGELPPPDGGPADERGAGQGAEGG